MTAPTDERRALRELLATVTAERDAWQAVARNCAQSLQLAALDERLDTETREALARCWPNQLAAHHLTLTGAD